jgi:hypothetical protein
MWNEAFASMKDKATPVSSASNDIPADFGKLEINFGDDASASKASDVKMNGPEDRVNGTRVVDGKTVDEVIQADGSIAHIYPAENGEQKTVFFKNADARDTRTPDRVEHIYETGRPEGQYRMTEYPDPAAHGGVRAVRSFENRPDGLTEQTEYDTKITKDMNIGGRNGLRLHLSYDSDKNEKGLTEENTFDTRYSGGVESERTYDASKNGGVAFERTQNGKTLRTDAKKQTVEEKKEAAPAPEYVPDNRDFDE